MKSAILRILLPSVLILALFSLSSCASTRTENGVTIEKKRSLNPLDYIPYL